MRWKALLSVALAAVASAETPLSKSGTVAVVNDEPITSAQLEAAIRPELEAMEERIRQLRNATLVKLIDNALIAQAARSRGITTDAFLLENVESIQLTENAVEDAYNRSSDQFRGVLPAEAKYRIRRTLEDNARAAGLRSLLERLRANARVTNQLVIDRSKVLAAASQEGPFRGSVMAPVTIVEFSDFECPYCRAAQPVLNEVLGRWPGQVRLVYKHFPLEQHPNAAPAARGAACAGKQGRFWPVHDLLFDMQGGLTYERIRDAAVRGGVEVQSFENCMRSAEIADQVRRDMVTGRVAGVTGTPSFFVDGEAVSSPSALIAAVEARLRSKN